MAIRFEGGSVGQAGTKRVLKARPSTNITKWFNLPVSDGSQEPELPEDPYEPPSGPPSAPILNPPSTPPLPSNPAPPVVPVVSLAANLILRGTPGGTSAPYNYLDRRYYDVTQTVNVTDFEISVFTQNIQNVDEVILTVDNPAIAEFVSPRRLEYRSTGTTIVRASYQSVEMATLSITTSTNPVSVNAVLIEFLPNTASLHCEQAILTRIAGKDPVVAKPIYTTQNHATGVYIRNPSCWAADLVSELTCLSPWNSTGSNTRAGTLITPRHIIFATHYEIAEGATIRFVTANNQVITRTMVKRARMREMTPGISGPSAFVGFSDLTIGVLNEDVPNTIKPCKVMPSNYWDYFPVGPWPVAGLCLDQEEKALVTDLLSWRDGGGIFIRFHHLQSNPFKTAFYEDKIVGDSGNPAFLIVNNELVLLTVWTGGGGGAGTFVGFFNNEINQLIQIVDAAAGVSTGYTITPSPMAGLNTYPATP